MSFDLAIAEIGLFRAQRRLAAAGTDAERDAGRRDIADACDSLAEAQRRYAEAGRG
ncbi:hypothetical protein IU443_29685 [Nocardia farcinica]|uniref:Uncharacterized protein n=1 Tax=Nocardia farcinica TaxID=37329 RepID=A0A0H5PAP0_NOCFR|nr:hypothetical protein [Nocardia farcinica]SLG33804.1 Uncharacterised protein [Mycobacteroides abscessus subsp. abscessus]MBF6394103.1 hypothetical protein [Nocardia farcinica]PFW98692.1 hypothetical protein CJ469_05945 [Nocardia farcinica]PFX04356.1 hypothetical protein CJ468_05602 [Nocardia farcinica]CRY84334.1 Uncharacterised protein [Nocardia farcinica]